MRGKGEIVGVVDFGSHDLRVLVGRRDDEGAIHIIGYGTASGRGCVSQGVIQDVGAAQMALRRALVMAEKSARVKLSSLFCAVNGRNVETFLREGNVEIADGTVEPNHLEEARDIASRDILAPGKKVLTSITAQEWYVDDLRVLDPLGIRGQVLKTRVHFARLPAVIEDNIVACIESQGRELEDLLFQPLAAALGCLTPEDMELGAMVLDMGRSTTGLALYRDYGILATHCFEWGGYHLTRDVAAGLQISFDEADQLIHEYGISDEYMYAALRSESTGLDPALLGPVEGAPARIKLSSAVSGAPTIVERADLDGIVYDRARELMVKTHQFLNARGLAKHLVRGVVLTGGTGALKNFVPLAESVFQTPCRVGLPSTIRHVPHDLKTPAYTACIGLVRHAFDYRTAAMNGRLDGRGVLTPLRRVSRFVKKYLF